MNQGEGLLAQLAARAYLYHLFQSLFGNEPGEGALAIANGEVTREALEIMGEMAKEAAAADAQPAGAGEDGAGTFVEAAGGFAAAVTAAARDLPAVRRAYASLFVGPASLPAPPWESVFRTGRALLFQESTLEVRQAYRAQGLEPACYPHVADDHIAIELDFMASLGDRALEACELEDRAGMQGFLDASAAFLDDHLLVWAPAYAEAVAQSDPSGLYAATACLMVRCLRLDRRFIAQLPAATEA